jgi:hypothetical protein
VLQNSERRRRLINESAVSVAAQLSRQRRIASQLKQNAVSEKRKSALPRRKKSNASDARSGASDMKKRRKRGD